jgi:hypothetical protein
MAMAAFMVSLVLVGAGVWLVRLPLAHFIISGALSERGIEADFDVVELNWGSARLDQLRLGAAADPDVQVSTALATWRWRGLSPQLEALTLIEPRARLRIDQSGRVSAGALDRYRSSPRRTRPSLPELRLTIEDGLLDIEAPFGVVTASVRSDGVIGRDFAARAEIAETTQRQAAYALSRGAAQLTVEPDGSALAWRLSATAQSTTWNETRLDGVALRARGRIASDLSALSGDTEWQVGHIAGADTRATRVSGGARLNVRMRDDSLQLESWSANGALAAQTLTAAGNSLTSPQLETRGASAQSQGRATWRLVAATFEGIGMVSQAPSAAGALRIAPDGAISGNALIELTRARLNNSGRRALHAALPELGDAPLGPTFASAREALLRAGQSFAARISLTHEGTMSAHIARLSAPISIRANSGTELTVSALRDDTPALQLNTENLSITGAVATQLTGGGAPSAELLLDTIAWTPERGWDANGTLSIARWRTENASIEASELAISMNAAKRAGRIDVAGPLLVSGPLGDGAVQGLNTALDLALLWDANGWRALPTDRQCQNVRAERVEAAGLAFSQSVFALCPLNGALIAANARGDLSGGISIERLGLAGRMAGPEAQPARLTAASVSGRFSGRAGATVLDLDARNPTLAITLAPERVLNLALRRVTARARVAGGWSVEGRFEQGALADPNLPGTVTAIEGGWNAAPEDNKPVIRVNAGEALLTAHAPASDAERPLFNPLRIVEMNAELRDGAIDANGAIMLVEGERRLAQFTARHNVSAGIGEAEVTATDLQFGPTLQPFEISEQMRGLVENVRGPATITANIDWTNASLAARGRVRLDGVSLATSTIPVVEHVRGEVFFDDLFLLTTPPGQSVTVGLVNPGVAVSNGRVRFQLLTEQRVAIEQADFDFASGTLAMAPTTITLGADETRFSLTLSDVDAAGLMQNLNIPDLSVTGRIEGEFPLLLTRRSAFIQNGVLRAQDGGGTIAYTGNAGAGATGAAAIAFDALKSFRYDHLELTLNGDLSGEVVSAIEFSGENEDRPVDLGPIAPIPGVGSVTVRGVPFDFNVRVTAPFRRLAQTVASITDPGAILDSARDQEPPETVDPAPTPPG